MNNFHSLALLALAPFSTTGFAQDVVQSYQVSTLQADWTAASCGWPIANAGDVNGDGIPDQVLGNPGNGLIAHLAGRAEVRSGADGSVLYTFYGSFAAEGFGSAVCGAGDLNNDGRADILVGAPTSGGSVGTGSVSAFSGLNGALLYKVQADNTQAALGQSVTSLGDVDGDGHDDFAIGSSFGPSRIHSGATGAALHDLSSSPTVSSCAGLSSGFDLDQDGVQDVLLGVPYDSGNGFRSGRASIYSGANGSHLLTVFGEGTQDRLGTFTTFVNDMNGDGVVDFAVVASPFSTHDRLRMYSGLDGSKLWEVESGELDMPMDNIGDYNGDGIDDLVVGVASSDQFGQSHGETQIRSGADGGVLLSFPASPQVDSDFPPTSGWSVSSAGDFDGDGKQEWLVSSFDFYVRVYSADKPGNSYCTSTANSSGQAARIMAAGNRSTGTNDLEFHAGPVPDGFALFFYGTTQTQVPFGDGFRCVAGSLSRFTPTSSNSGWMVSTLDVLNPSSPAGQITAGSVWNFQGWFRDPAAGASGFNTTDALTVTFLP